MLNSKLTADQKALLRSGSRQPRSPGKERTLVRAALFYYFVYLVFEGALRKWALPSLSNELFLLKDLLLAVAFVAYCFSREGMPHNRYLDPTDNLIWIM